MGRGLPAASSLGSADRASIIEGGRLYHTPAVRWQYHRNRTAGDTTHVHNPTRTIELYITCCDAGAAHAEALAGALGRRVRVAFHGSAGLGADALAEAARCVEHAGVFAVLLAQASPFDARLRGDVNAMLDRVRRDPSCKLVPIYLDGASERDRNAIVGLGSLQGIAVKAAGGIPAVADKLAELVRGLRAQWQRRASIAVVAVQAELGDIQAAVAERLGRMAAAGDLAQLDAAQPGALEQAGQADFCVVLAGGRTGGTGALAALVKAGATGLKLDRIDPDKVPDAELLDGRALRREIAESFATAGEAADRVQKHFDTWLRIWAPRDPGKGALLEPWERAYLQARSDRWELGSYGGLAARAGRRRLDRARLYVSLRAAADRMHVSEAGRIVLSPPPDRDAEPGKLDPDARELPGLATGRQGKAPVGPYLEQAAAHPELPYLVIEGEAGAGKTVLLQHIAHTLACLHLDRPIPEAMFDPRAFEAGAPLVRIPVLLEARRLAERLESGDAGELPAVLAAELGQATGGDAIDEQAVRDGLAAGRYLLLVDSLDEVPSVRGRERVVACLEAAAALRPPWRFILTTRPTAHTGVALRDKHLRFARIAPLDREAIERMVARWSAAMGEDDTYRRELLEAIVHMAGRHPAEGDSSLVANPLLLACTMLVYDQQRLLPDSAAVLFERMVTLLCDAKPSPGLPSEAKRDALERVFSAIQEAGGTSRPTRELAEELLRLRPDVKTLDGATDLLDQLAAETGLLRFESVAGRRGQDERIARPWHRSFQQYLVARRLASAAESVAAETDRLFVAQGGRPARIADPEWEGVLRFLLGAHAQRGSDAARAYVARLLEHAAGPEGPPPGARRGRVLGLAAQGLAEEPDVLPADPLRDAVRDAVAKWFAAEGEAWPLADRLLALEGLGRLGDPRLDGDPWIEVPGGSFTMGDASLHWAVKPRIEHVKPFRMFCRPVTVQDYAAFVEAGGYRDAGWWAAGRDDDHTEPANWSEQRFHPNRPVVGVSWYEAMAYCRWASDVWDLDVDLPAEVEWEFAARGPEGRMHAWGDDDPGEGDEARANYWWANDPVGHATPVGAFPRGNRGGFLDVTGNVWEWCSDPWTDDRRPTPVAAERLRGALRVVRGGSWDNEPWNLRCAVRFGSHPRYRDVYLGFRVVCRGSRPR